MFILHSYGIFYLISVKPFDMPLEEDCFDHDVFKRVFFLFSMRFPKGWNNFNLLYKIIDVATSWNFGCMASDLYE